TAADANERSENSPPSSLRQFTQPQTRPENHQPPVTTKLWADPAAALDGAGLWARFRNVTVPAIRPSIAIATTLGIVQGLRIFDQILALTGGGPNGSTETLATQVYKNAFTLGQFGFGSALALVLTVLILVFAVLQQYATRDRSARKA
ncbi:carbohydrate ABC transporter permease, partial [Subtercola boreus]|uniref:carbohydrate ABC transporter permease n=1 Tax=Subtercola boreus TaxID=120213 RepID=UPI0011C02160